MLSSPWRGTDPRFDRTDLGFDRGGMTQVARAADEAKQRARRAAKAMAEAEAEAAALLREAESIYRDPDTQRGTSPW